MITMQTKALRAALAATLGLAALTSSALAATALFKQALEAGKQWEQRKMTTQAVLAYTEALKQAENDAERSQAQLGIANNTPILYPSDDPKNSGVARLAAYRKVLELPEAPATARAQAHLGVARTHAQLGRHEDALASLARIVAMTDAGIYEYQYEAHIDSGESLIALKRYDDARKGLALVTSSTFPSLGQRVKAHRTAARAYLAQESVPAALAELGNAAAIAGLTDPQKAEVRIGNGDLLMQEKRYAAARGEYEKVAVLADATTDNNVVARFKIAETHFHEKNYAPAREIWNQVLGMEGSQRYARQIHRAMGLSLAAEKSYPAAREAYQKWLSAAGAEMADKVSAWQHIAQTYVEEKNFAAAREALGNIGKDAQAGSGLHLRQQFDIAGVYRTEGDFAGAVNVYKGILAAVPAQANAPGAQKSSDHYAAENLVWEAADAMAKEPASQAAVYPLYEALEAHHPYDLQKARANLAMGDLLLLQNKRTEAKAKYQKALDLRKNYDEGKTAAEKIRQLEAQQAGAG